MRTALFLLGALALVACNQTDAPKEAPKVAKGPAPAPAQKARLVKKAPKGAASQPAGSQPVRAAGSQPAGSQPARAAGSQPAKGAKPFHPAPPGSGQFSGTINLLPDIRDRVKAGTTLFIIVRRDEGEGKRGMMLAAKKLAVTGPDMFPLAYTVTPQDVMMQGTKLWGPIKVEARVDADGDALSKVPGDVTGGPIKSEVGKDGVDFVLDKVL